MLEDGFDGLDVFDFVGLVELAEGEHAVGDGPGGEAETLAEGLDEVAVGEEQDVLAGGELLEAGEGELDAGEHFGEGFGVAWRKWASPTRQ